MWGGEFVPFLPPKNGVWGSQNPPKMTFFGQKVPYWAIGSPSNPKWIEHWLNMVEFGPFLPPKNFFNKIRRKLPMVQYGHFEPKKTVFGRFWGSLVTFVGALMAQTGPPGCV